MYYSLSPIQKSLCGIAMVLAPFWLSFIWYGDFSGVSYYVPPTRLFGTSLLLGLILSIWIKYDYLEMKYEDWEEKPPQPSPITLKILHFVLCQIFTVCMMMFLFLISIRLSDEQILDVKMGGLDIHRSRQTTYHTWIDESPHANYLVGHGFRINGSQFARIRANPNVQIAVRKNAFGFSVEVLL